MRIELSHISKRYTRGGPLVVDDVSFGIAAGETVSVFGDSGNGKSTIGQILAGILPPSGGSVSYEGAEVACPYRGRVRREIQMLFQHPEVAFNPKLRLIDSIREPYALYRIPCEREALLGYLSGFGIYKEHLSRYPSQLSGGELQRLALARVMAVEPRVIVLDEPTSMLDAISQAQVIQILREYQKQKQVSYLFISHDIRLCERVSDRILYLNGGRLAEERREET